MEELVTVYELIKRADGSVASIGNSLLVTQEEAEELIGQGTHKFIESPVVAEQGEE